MAAIAAEIDRRGPITFARFMELALYTPGIGYYRVASARPGRGGDFLTAPETHPIFGWALARQAEEVWQLLGRPEPFVIQEHGSGAGTLVLAILEGLKAAGSALADVVRFQPVEIEPRRTEELARRLELAGHPERLVRDGSNSASEGLPRSPIDGLVLANEVLDALPVHRVRGTGDGIEELYVDFEAGQLREVAGPPSDLRLAARLDAEGVQLRAGQQAEISLVLDKWVEVAARGLARGLLLIVDYGHPAAELYDPVRRPRGTLLGYRRHRAVDDPFRNVGRQDLTAHVDVTAVERAGIRAGLDHIGTTTQAELLAGLGVGDLLTELRERPETTADAYLEARAALVRMIDPASMGRFRALGFSRGLPASATLRGFGFRLSR
jgi:SAM-dependent MidA family methyltransferase